MNLKLRYPIALLATTLTVLYGHGQNVGVGEPDPNAKFEVKSDDTNSGSALRVKNVAQDTLVEVTNDGRVGIGTGFPALDAALEIKSPSRGVLIPRMSSLQRTLISGGSPSESLLVYDTDTKTFWYFDDQQWVEIASGDLSVFASIQWLGTLDQAPDSAVQNQAYYSEEDGQSYIFDGAAWQTLVKNGLAGAPGSKWSSGLGAPVSVAVAGDQYLDLLSGDVHQYDGNVWVITTNLRGPQGITGLRGNTWRTGTSHPVPGLTDSIGDMYLAGENGDFFNYTDQGWVRAGNLNGNRGSSWTVGQDAPVLSETDSLNDAYLDASTGLVYTFDGAEWVKQGGIKGNPGMHGNSWRSGTTIPQITPADSLGDFYLNTVTGIAYEYDGSAWITAATLAGEDGLRGLTWRSGTLPPLQQATDSTGDFYLDTRLGNIYQFNGTTWDEKMHIYGEDGLRGNSWRSGNGDPAVLDVDSTGDHYLDFVTQTVHQFDGTQWNEKIQLKGQNGLRGHRWRVSDTDPTVLATDSLGDFYLDTRTYDLFQFDGTDWTALDRLQGADGIRGTRWTTGNTAATISGDEIAGDLYLNLTSGAVYEFDGSGWGQVTNIAGQDGLDGQRGHVWRSGATLPDDNANDATGDYYLQTTTYDLFQHDGTDWVLMTRIEGTDGVDGADGERGSTWSTGNGIPSDEASDQAGDQYLDLDNGDIHTHDGTGWVQDGNIRGEDGLRGHVWRSGIDPPTLDVSDAAGDYYLETTNYDVYSFDGTNWIPLTRIKGVDGVRGTTWRTGVGNPDVEISDLQGDHYLDQNNGDFYVFDGTDWNLTGNIRGADGQSFIGASVNETLRHDGTEWVASEFLQVADDHVAINASSIALDATLNIEGNIKIADGTESDGRALISNIDGLASWGFPSSIADADLNTSITTDTDPDKIIIKTGGAQRITILDDGKVGIGAGAINPTTDLHLDGSIRIADGTQASGKVLTTDANGLASWGYGTNIYSKDGARWLVADDGDDIIKLGTNSTDRLIIDANGNVGIGNSTPTHTLDIAGDVRIADGTQGAGKAFISDASGSGSWGYPTRIQNLAGITSVVTDGDAGNDIIMRANATELLRLDAETGNIGVRGVNAPTAPIHVDGTIRLETGDEALGKVLVSDANGTGSWDHGTNLYSNDDATYVLTEGTSGTVVLGTNSMTRVTLDEDGEMGIGTTSPTANLHVEGTMRVVTGNEAAGKVLVSDANGNLDFGYSWIASDDDFDTKMQFDNGNDPDSITIVTAGNTAIVIDEEQNLILDQDAAYAKLSVGGDISLIEMPKPIERDDKAIMYLSQESGRMRVVDEEGYDWSLTMDIAHFEKQSENLIGAGAISTGNFGPRSFNTSNLGEGDYVTCTGSSFPIKEGTYYVEAYCAGYEVDMHMCQLQKLDGTKLISGTLEYAGPGEQSYSHLSGIIYLATDETLLLMHRGQVTNDADDMGVAFNTADWGANPVVASIKFIRIR